MSEALSARISLLTGKLTGKSAKFQDLFPGLYSRKLGDSKYLGYERGLCLPGSNREFFRRIREFDFPVTGLNNERISFPATITAGENVPGARSAQVDYLNRPRSPTFGAVLRRLAPTIFLGLTGRKILRPSTVGGPLFCQ
jgi:hypothetical protein